MSTRHGVDVLARAIHKRLEESGSLDAFLKKATEWNLPFGRLVWTGFKPAQERISVTGQWLLFPPKDWEGEERVYGVSLPPGGSGIRGRVTRGQSLGFGPDDFEGFHDRDGLKAALLEGLIELLHIVFEDEPPWLATIISQGEEVVVKGVDGRRR